QKKRVWNPSLLAIITNSPKDPKPPTPPSPPSPPEAPTTEKERCENDNKMRKRIDETLRTFDGEKETQALKDEIIHDVEILERLYNDPLKRKDAAQGLIEKYKQGMPKIKDSEDEMIYHLRIGHIRDLIRLSLEREGSDPLSIDCGAVSNGSSSVSSP